MMSLKERFSTPGPYRPFFRKWPKKTRKAIWWLFPLELAGVVPSLVIFGLAQPNLYRTDMWKIGWDNRLNSNPNMILYAYANHEPLPKIALIWTRTFTDFNVAISVLSLFFLLAKLTAFIMKVWYPALAVFINVAMVALFTVSVYGQIGPDYTDSRYPAPVAWYFRYGCDMARPYGAYKSCKFAQGSLVITIYMLCIYTTLLGIAIFAVLPNKEIDVVKEVDSDDEDDRPQTTANHDWEMQSYKSPGIVTSTPFTPRTQAFQALDRGAYGRPDASKMYR